MSDKKDNTPEKPDKLEKIEKDHTDDEGQSIKASHHSEDLPDIEDEESQLKEALGVRKKKTSTDKSKKNKVGMILLVVVIVFFIMMYFSGEKQKHSSTQNNATQNQSYDLSQQQTENQKLLSKIGQQQKLIIKEGINPTTPIEHQAATPQESDTQLKQKELEAKEMSVRMNAPMQMSFQTQKLTTAQQAQLDQQKANNNAPVSGLSNGSTGADFANAQSKSYSSVSAQKIPHPDYTIVQGEMLHAVLTTAIDNELAGMIEATITRPVYSYNQSRILLPVGSRLVGQFRAGGGNAASTRIYAIWNRVITPDGISVMINSTSTDELGRSGQAADYIDTHFFKMFGTATIISLIGASASVAGGNANAMYPSTQDQYRQAITQSFGQVSNKVLSKDINLAPTMYVNQGTRINVFVAHDLDFYGVLNQ